MLECWLNITFIALFQMGIQSFVTFIDGTSSNAQCSIGVVVSSRPSSLGDSCLVLNSGRPCRVLPRLDQASLGLDP